MSTRLAPNESARTAAGDASAAARAGAAEPTRRAPLSQGAAVVGSQGGVESRDRVVVLAPAAWHDDVLAAPEQEQQAMAASLKRARSAVIERCRV